MALHNLIKRLLQKKLKSATINYFAVNPMGYDGIGVSNREARVEKNGKITTVPYENMFDYFRPDASVIPTYTAEDHEITAVYNTFPGLVNREENWMCFAYSGTPFISKIYCSINSEARDNTYLAGEDFDLSTLKVTTYATNNAFNSYPGNALPADITITGGKSLKEGANLITVRYGDLEASIEVHALPNPDAPTETPPVDTPKLQFTDVPENAWYYNDVMTACTKGLFNGKSSTIFAPNDNMTVSEVVKLAACMHQLHKDGKVTLTNGSPWYVNYMKYALDNGIIATDLSSRAGEVVTRQEYIGILYKALPESEYGQRNTIADNAIPDVKMDNEYAKEIYTLYRAGILTGGDGHAFKLTTNIQRCEVAATLVRMMDKDARKDVTL